MPETAPAEIVQCLPGFYLELDPDDTVVSAHIRRDSVWERVESEAFAALLRPGDIVVDAGAHIGYYTCLAASIVGPEGLVYAFEPNTHTFPFLFRNVRRLGRALGFYNVRCLPLALGNRTGESLFGPIKVGNTGDSRVGGGSFVPMVRLDEFLSMQPLAPCEPWALGDRRHVDVLKSDTQGCEWDVLQGMGRSVDTLRAALIEWAPDLLQGAQPADLAGFLDARFALQHTEEQEPLVSVDAASLLERMRGDVVCRRKRG